MLRTLGQHGPARPRRATSRSAPSRDRPAPARLLAQRGLFFGPSALVPEDLYSVVERGRRPPRARPGDARPRHPGEHQHLLRPLPRHLLAALDRRRRGRGRGRRPAAPAGVRLMASDTNKVWRIVAARDLRDADATAVRLVGPIDRFVDGGGMWLELTTETGELTVSDVRWTVPVTRAGAAAPTSSSAPTTASTTASTRCQALAADPVAAGDASAPCTSSTRAATRSSRAPRFGEVAASLGDRLRYVRQPNLGGAGGFTRGLFDATAGEPDDARRRAADGRRRAARAGDPRAAHGVRREHHAPDDRRRADAQPAAPRPPAHLGRVRRPRSCSMRASRCPARCRRPTCSARTSGSCRSTRSAASTPSTTAGGPA